MTKEQSIEIAKDFTKMDFSNPMGWTGYYDTELKELQECIKTVLNMLKENEKKDKIIDLMAECIDVELSSVRLGTILNKNVKPLETYKEEIKQYFKSKAEKE